MTYQFTLENNYITICRDGFPHYEKDLNNLPERILYNPLVLTIEAVIALQTDIPMERWTEIAEELIATGAVNVD